MAQTLIVVVILSIAWLQSFVVWSFDPFMDQTMFMIDWKGPLLEPIEGISSENVVVMTKDKEQYRCILPEVYDKKRLEGADEYQGPTASTLMARLFQQTTCSYRLESYWTYELCHGKHLRQYHEAKEQGKKTKLQEYFLGFGDPNFAGTAAGSDTTDQADGTPPPADANVKSRRIDGVDLPYYEVTMKEGTPCDLTGKPRLTRVLYVCQPDGHGEVYEMKETSTCEYEVMVLVSVLCSHPHFRPKNPPMNKISCHSLSGSPQKPLTLDTWERETKRLDAAQQELLFGMPETDESMEAPAQPTERKVPKILTSKSTPALGVSTSINKLTDHQVLRDLLSGDYCLQGGAGWWKHEVCLGRYARQFHKDKNGEVSVLLGNFDEEAHIQWLAGHPNKKPKPTGQRKYLNYLYTGGDLCDLTGKPRKVEVRLKCVANSQSPHGVSLFLSEPSSCEYVLVVESAMLCELMDQADENALLKNVNL
ncbi:endoplasmic reticulum lectin 1-like isoform X2 [Littorina saxatilis]|uniref:Endoplasmic reticulum lectin 1 n=2 Tax=Littorina saxatilis TaxID=31220 RepID=A0AAN9GCS1_9CAEN